MARKAAVVEPKPNDGWVYTTEIQVNGRQVVPGTELKISGERGRFRFMQHVNTGTAEWIDVLNNDGTRRSFYPDRVQTVHVKNRTTANLATAYKEKRKAIKNS